MAPRPETKGGRPAAIAYLAGTLSHPEWLVARWLDRHSFDDVERWCRFNNAPPDVTVRPIGSADQRDLLTALETSGVPVLPALFVKNAIRLAPARDPYRLMLAEVLVQQKQYDRAVSVLTALLARGDDAALRAEAQALLGRMGTNGQAPGAKN